MPLINIEEIVGKLTGALSKSEKGQLQITKPTSSEKSLIPEVADKLLGGQKLQPKPQQLQGAATPGVMSEAPSPEFVAAMEKVQPQGPALGKSYPSQENTRAYEAKWRAKLHDIVNTKPQTSPQENIKSFNQIFSEALEKQGLQSRQGPSAVARDYEAKWRAKLNDIINSQLSPEKREAARVQGGYTTEAYRGTSVHQDTTSMYFRPPREEMGKDKLYSSDDPRIANMYASTLLRIDDPAIKEGAVIQPLWIDTRDFLVYDHGGGAIDYKKYEFAKSKAYKEGKKGFVIKNVIDEPDLSATSEPRTLYVAFPKYNTVKSKFASRFDPKDPKWLAGVAGVGILGAGGTAFMSDEAQAGPGEWEKVIKAYHASPHEIPFGRSLKPELAGGSESALGRAGQHPRGTAPEASGLQHGAGSYVAENKQVAEYYRRMFTNAGGQPAHIYEGNLQVNPDMLIDFEKPFAEQSPLVKKAILKVYGSEQEMLRPDRAKAEALAREGVQGVRYFDARSRAEGVGTRNYVLFNGELFNITAKYGLGALIGGGAMALGEDQAQAEEDTQNRIAGNKALNAAFAQEQQAKKLQEFGERRVEESKGGYFDDPFGRKGAMQDVGEAAKGITAGLDQATGVSPPMQIPDFMKRLVQHKGEWSEGEEKAFNTVVGGGRAALATLNTAFSLMQAAAGQALPVMGAGQAASKKLLDLAKGYIDRDKEMTSEAKEASKTMLELSVFGMGPPGFLMKGSKVAGVAGQASKYLQQQRAAGTPSLVSSIRSVLSPTSTEQGEAAAALIREHTGTAARDTAVSIAKLREDHAESAFNNFFNNNEKRFNEMSQFDQWQLLDYMQGRSKGKKLLDPELQLFADEFKAAMEEREAKIAATPSLAGAHMLQDYVTQYWKNPKAARAFVANWMKQGQGGSLKQRAYPTIADGLRAGLDPVTTNPFEIGAMYITNMDKYIANNRIMDAARRAGHVHYALENGRRAQRLQAQGMTGLNGRLAKKRTPAGIMQAYAPAEFAQVYNNFVSPGVYRYPNGARIYDALRSTSNLITSVELGLSGFHLVTMANEAWVADIAKSVGNIVGAGHKAAKGDFHDAMELLSRGVWGAAKAPLAPARLYRLGKKFEQQYLKTSPASLDMRRVLYLHEHAGGRGVGRGHAPDYRYTAAGSYFDALKRGTSLVSGTTPAQQIGRIFQTVAQPLFDVYIPRIKNGAFADLMSDWLKANRGASRTEALAVARRILDSVDNRFGEMIQDNIFWSNGLKQGAMLGMRSYSWNLGTVREIAGGAYKGLRHPSSLSIASKNYDPRSAYVVALPMVALMVGGIYEYMKTGKAPDDMLQAAVTPRTGGMAPGFGGRGMVPERTRIPGYMNDVMGWLHDPWQEALNKRATLWSVLGEVGSNKDWRGDPIISQDPLAPSWMKQMFKYATEHFTPFSTRQMIKGQPRGSNLSAVETMLGMRQAPSHMQDPKGYAAWKKFDAERKWRDKELRDRREELNRRPVVPYGGPRE
jgi:hypothetical protein